MSRAWFVSLALTACAAPGPEPGAGVAQDAATLLERGDQHFDARSYDNARRVYQLAAVAAGGEGDEARYVEAASQVAHVQALTGELEDARSWLESATDRIEGGAPRAWSRWLIARGALEHAEGKEERALATFEEAYEHARASDQPVRAVQAAQWATVAAGDERSVRWARNAIQVARGLEQPLLVASLWRQLGFLLEERSLHQEALDAFEQARTWTPADAERALLIADWSVGHGLRKVGRHAEARVILEDVHERARRRYRASRRPNDAEWVGQALVELGELDLAAGRTEDAIERWTQARDRLLEAGVRRLAPGRLRALEARLATARTLRGPAGG